MELMESIETKKQPVEINEKTKKSNPLYFYIHEEKESGKNRIITFCYLYDKESKMLKYGATIFKKENPKDCFSKKTHRQTAFDRFNKYPVVIDTTKVNLFEKDKWRTNVRRLLFENGVCYKPKKDKVCDEPEVCY